MDQSQSMSGDPLVLENESARLLQQMLLGLPLLTSSSHPLWQHQLCAWPGCDQPADSLPLFLAHLHTCHVLDERSAMQLRQQVELVDTLEHRLTKERGRLQAMMHHLHMKHSPNTAIKEEPRTANHQQHQALTNTTREPKEEETARRTEEDDNTFHPQPSTAYEDDVHDEMHASPASPPKREHSPTPTVTSHPSSTPQASPSTSNASTTSKKARVSDKSVVPISTEMSRNREYYRSNDVRPPYTYASLIRQAITESHDCQLTLNEIYTWFTDNFMYFRRNAATWKNAVRHNLSLHKCFVRVEQNVKGAVWTVDDGEFYKRRSQRVSVGRSSVSTPSLPSQSLVSSRLSPSESAASLLNSTAFTSLLTDNPLSILAAASALNIPHTKADTASLLSRVKEELG